MVFAYLKYLFTRGNAHSIHSPFVFELYNSIIAKPYTLENNNYKIIEDRRAQLKKNQQTIEVTDYGAGSRKVKGNTRIISEIAHNAEKNKKVGYFLAKLIEKTNAKVVFDLGTSFGITTAYQSTALQTNSVHVTFEGCPTIASIAQETLNLIDAKTQIKIGPLEVTLEKALNEIEQLDFVYFDANHQYEPTIRYFEQCLPKAHNNTVFVFDDIHWSSGMEKAWDYIIKHPEAIVTIDLFELGLVFFRKTQVKEHFVLSF
jgi:predicted O-methyltransferase YrrM